MTKENVLLTRPLPGLFFRYVAPAMAAMVLDGIQGIIDGIFIGNYVGADAMASVNIANPYYQIIIGSSMVICSGTMSAAGRALGAGDEKRAKDIYHSALLVLAAISVALMLAGIFGHRIIARLLGASPALLENSCRYIRALAVFVPAISFKILFGFSGRLIGRPQLYLAGTVTTISSNIFLDYLAVGVLGLGTAGAAGATGLAYLGGTSGGGPPAASERDGAESLGRGVPPEGDSACGVQRFFGGSHLCGHGGDRVSVKPFFYGSGRRRRSGGIYHYQLCGKFCDPFDVWNVGRHQPHYQQQLRGGATGRGSGKL